MPSLVHRSLVGNLGPRVAFALSRGFTFALPTEAEGAGAAGAPYRRERWGDRLGLGRYLTLPTQGLAKRLRVSVEVRRLLCMLLCMGLLCMLTRRPCCCQPGSMSLEPRRTLYAARLQRVDTPPPLSLPPSPLQSIAGV